MPLASYINAQKIALDSSNVINATLVGNANVLVSQQALSGDPLNSPATAGSPTGYFSYGTSTQIYYPLEIVIDLKGIYDLTNVYMYDVQNNDSIYVSSGTPGNWSAEIAMTTNQYNSWRGYTLTSVTTRYLLFKFVRPGSLIAQIVLYGTLSKAVTITPPLQVTVPKPLMEDFIGINTFNDIPDSLNKVVKQLREYHNWGWDEGNTDLGYIGFPFNLYGWNPSWVSGWNFDAFYGRTKAEGTTVSPDLQYDAPYMLAFNPGANNSNRPIRGNKDPENAASYPEHADWMYQYTARYGSTAVPISNLKLQSANALLTGLGYLNYIENWNEPDKNWFSDTAYFTPFQFAAMCSADYDGHKGTMGTTFGVKNADPTMNMVMAGLANADTAYMSVMLFWANANTVRNGTFPADVLNFHHYSNDGGGQGATQTQAYSPEQDSLQQKVATVVAFRNKNLPGKPVWISEFGYDTNPNSVQAAPAIGTATNWETQARWLIRSYLAIAAGGADKAHMFMLPDVDETSYTKFSSSGLVTPGVSNGGYAPYTKKQSWYYLYTFRKRLTGYQFAGQVSSGNPGVLVYSFTKASNPTDSIIYAVWSPTRTDATISNYQFTLPSPLTAAANIELTNGDTLGVQTPLTVTGGQVTLTVNEKPDLILATKSMVTSVTSPANTAAVSVYPNPFTDTFNVQFPQGFSNASMSLLDVRGRLVKKITVNPGGITTIDGSGLGNGVYMLQVNTSTGQSSIKVVKQD